MINKLLKGILIAALVVGGLYLYFLYSGTPEVLRNRMQAHQIYTLIFFVSIVVLYMLQWGGKFFKFLAFVIIIINLFIIGDVFFRNNIWLNSQQFMTLFALILLALAVSYITHWVRYLLMIIVGLGIGFVLLTGMLPMYENMPNISDFIQSQKTQIINEGANQWMLIIKNALWSKEIAIQDVTANDIDLSQKTQISYSSKTKTDNEKIFIDLGNGTFINLNPQSAVTLEQSWTNTVMQILQGNVQYYAPSTISWALTLIGKYTGKNIQNIQNTIRWNMVSEFEKDKEEFFINSLGGNMVLNPVIDKIISFFINTLYSISPKTYQKNLTNYNTIREYLGITGSTSQNFSWESIRSMIDDMMSNAKQWAGETRILNQLFNK